jgi:hypothetical protein
MPNLRDALARVISRATKAGDFALTVPVLVNNRRPMMTTEGR